jgi:hypothetical protein
MAEQESHSHARHTGLHRHIYPSMISNGGTGPAIIEWLRLRWNGQPTAGPRDLLDRGCKKLTSGRPVPISRNLASGMTLPAGQSTTVLYLRAADANPDSYQHLDTEAPFKVDDEACYCSVLDECWITDFKTSRPKGTKSCEPIPEAERW